MSRLTNDKKIKLLKIEKARLNLVKELEFGTITQHDILNLINKDINYYLSIYNKNCSNREKILRDIFINPFLLCDIDSLSDEIKSILPLFLNVRYTEEKEELEMQYNKDYFDKNEYEKKLDELEFCFYKSSKDGKNIIKMTQITHIKQNKEKIKK